MSSSTRCDAVSVFSQLEPGHVHIAEVLAGVTLSVNAFECWHGPSNHDLHIRLVKDLTCAAASQAYVELTFSACGLLYFGRRSVQVSRSSVCIKIRQCWNASCPR